MAAPSSISSAAESYTPHSETTSTGSAEEPVSLRHPHRRMDPRPSLAGPALQGRPCPLRMSVTPAGEIDPATWRQRDHKPSSASNTRRSARASTCASARSGTPPGRIISISPSGRGADGGPHRPRRGSATQTHRLLAPGVELPRACKPRQRASTRAHSSRLRSRTFVPASTSVAGPPAPGSRHARCERSSDWSDERSQARGSTPAGSHPFSSRITDLPSNAVSEAKLTLSTFG